MREAAVGWGRQTFKKPMRVIFEKPPPRLAWKRKSASELADPPHTSLRSRGRDKKQQAEETRRECMA